MYNMLAETKLSPRKAPLCSPIERLIPFVHVYKIMYKFAAAAALTRFDKKNITFSGCLKKTIIDSASRSEGGGN